jgi:hypothetical protein
VIAFQAPEPTRHPADSELKRFMRGTLSPEARRAVVRHLLTRCPQCLKVTSDLWRIGDRAPLKPFTAVHFREAFRR